MNRRLHEVTADCLALEALLLENGGEWSPEVEELIQEMQGNKETKVDGYAALIRDWESDADRWGEEEKRVAARRKALENAAARLKARLAEQLTAMGDTEVITPRFKVALQANAPNVEVLVGVDRLPKEFVREIPPVPAKMEVDRAAILEALKSALPPKPKKPSPDDLTPEGKARIAAARELVLVDRGEGVEVVTKSTLLEGEEPLAKIVHSTHLRIR